MIYLPSFLSFLLLLHVAWSTVIANLFLDYHYIFPILLCSISNTLFKSKQKIIYGIMVAQYKK